MTGEYTPGSLVNVRGRDWVVLPPDQPEVLRLRPLTGGNVAEVGVFLPLEGQAVRPSSFPDPDPEHCGDATDVMTLYDAARLSLRASAALFRSLGRISVVPRPYGLLPCRHDGLRFRSSGRPDSRDSSSNMETARHGKTLAVAFWQTACGRSGC